MWVIVVDINWSILSNYGSLNNFSTLLQKVYILDPSGKLILDKSRILKLWRISYIYFFYGLDVLRLIGMFFDLFLCIEIFLDNVGRFVKFLGPFKDVVWRFVMFLKTYWDVLRRFGKFWDIFFLLFYGCFEMSSEVFECFLVVLGGFWNISVQFWRFWNALDFLGWFETFWDIF